MSTLQKLAIGAGIPLLLIGGTAAITYWQITRSLAAKEQVLQERAKVIEAEVAEQNKAIADAKQQAERARLAERQAKAEVTRLLKERTVLVQAAAEAGQARERVREEVSRVPQSEVRRRIRAGLATLRAGPSRVGERSAPDA